VRRRIFELTDTGARTLTVLEEAVVVMTLRQAKMLSHSLNVIISNFEAVNGPIPVPLDKLQKIDADVGAQTEANKKSVRKKNRAAPETMPQATAELAPLQPASPHGDSSLFRMLRLLVDAPQPRVHAQTSPRRREWNHL
jgi:hypothetical protein